MSTLKSMKRIARVEDHDKTLEELSSLYVESGLFPSYLAMAFIKLQGIIKSATEQYESFDTDDVDSMALEKLNYCMQHFEDDKGATFTTYFYTIFSGALKTHFKSMVRDKRVLNTFNRVSLEYLNDEYDFEVADNEHSEIDDVIDDVAHMCKLDDREVILCRMLVQGYTQLEISKMFGLSPSMIAHIKLQVKTKMASNVEYFGNLAI